MIKVPWVIVVILGVILAGVGIKQLLPVPPVITTTTTITMLDAKFDFNRQLPQGGLQPAGSLVFWRVNDQGNVCYASAILGGQPNTPLILNALSCVGK